MKFLIGTKKAMTQVFDEAGRSIIGTVVLAGPAIVTQIKTADKDNCNAVQIGFGAKRAKTASKSARGHASNAGAKDGQSFQFLRQFPVTNPADFKLGDTIDLSIFEEGETIQVSGISKGKGFQGVVKRHGFHGGPRSHGQKHSEREAGSIGTGGVQRVFKGMRMAGRMGSDRVTEANSQVIKINKETNEILIKGTIPGRRGTLIEILSK
ncbi:MAG: 50S ribosomal protein L3 [Candidatus Vogelbacteria bacterium CG22_combo_CG10-13_8_21_14_all_37_9]|uniref:50S ribosomal protein L3 n=1 Tax=Candidatus Vogelbacteria bacterium CG22_combo_CG10-13_8_21_14_all_37_9 TaxID=1975046 RepID=A0A2H0BKT5_9BACT|nr:MAG: 50S ribosomal protein L3 [bacterium CG10_37_50]PIP58287.1 MAG: 50S ribosomal protein L3 [Candidatus Vogelbacteria bacterium CG22_combo_CG10-13_8_21_14_all_37_9]